MRDFGTRALRFGLLVGGLALGGAVPAGGQAPAQDPRWETPPEEAYERELAGRTRPDLSLLEGEIDRATYRLGPGDELALWLAGERVTVTTLQVTPEGMVLLNPSGPLPVAGSTVDEAQEAIRRALSPYYRNVTIRVHLASVRRFRVHVLGEVLFPGVYLASAVERAAGVIDRARGVTEIGSTRNIRVLRENGETLPVDLVGYQVLGDLSRNPRLSGGDVVHVPPAGESVEIAGAVFRPGRIEIRPGETVEDLIALVGGLRPEATGVNVEIHRFSATDPAVAERELLNLDGFGRREVPDAGRVLRDGDRLYVRSIPEYHEQNAVLVRGEVLYPGRYAIEEDRERLTDLVGRAGGFTTLAALREATVTRAERDTVVDQEYLRLLNMPVADMTKTEYEYFKFRSRQRRGVMVVDFEKLFVGGDRSHDLILRNGDVIDIPRKPLTVAVEGQVASPGHVVFSPGRGVDYYVAQAGGYSWNANKRKVRVIKVRSGEWKWPRQVRILEPGDTIWVPEKREIEWWALFMDVTRVLAQLATVYIVVDRAVMDN